MLSSCPVAFMEDASVDRRHHGVRGRSVWDTFAFMSTPPPPPGYNPPPPPGGAPPPFGAPQYGAPPPAYGAPQYGAPQYGAPPPGYQAYGQPGGYGQRAYAGFGARL